MKVDSIKWYNERMYDQMIVKRSEKRIEELRLDEIRIKARLREEEMKRIELNRILNRNGQNVDIMV